VRGSRRFSQAIAEGDGISVIAEVDGPDAARVAEAQGADGLVVRGRLDDLRAATGLPILWGATGSLAEASAAGADACLLVFAAHADDGERLERLHAEALALGLDCVVSVEDEDELEAALERVDPEIFLLAGPAERAGDLEHALELLPDVPAGKLAIAEVMVSGPEDVAELERAGVDAVIVGTGNVAELVGGAPPSV
jgi:indole-3-glycerol phosphate synthase